MSASGPGIAILEYPTGHIEVFNGTRLSPCRLSRRISARNSLELADEHTEVNLLRVLCDGK
jgi:hypothetical protein